MYAQRPRLLVEGVRTAGRSGANGELPVKVVAPQVEIHLEIAEEGAPLPHLVGNSRDVVAQEPRPDGVGEPGPVGVGKGRVVDLPLVLDGAVALVRLGRA